VTRQSFIVEQEGKIVQSMIAKRKNMEVTGKRERNKEIRTKSKEPRMPWVNE
jgi:hypothetical protein